ncbi:MAG: hypothetical protein NZ700_01360 [Gemmataceae bacterium]|nr:hypothetical protein [Gemmataceae bacterium]MDW8266777.1 hypothetical protein [Gemmataceae bacterium]
MSGTVTLAALLALSVGQGRESLNGPTEPATSVPARPGECPICVPVPTKSKTTRVYYDVAAKHYCLPRCRLPFVAWLQKRAGCDVPNCGKVRTRRVLVRKTATEECDTYKCVPKYLSE